MTEPELLQDSEIKTYWDRLKIATQSKKEGKQILTIESFKEPCKVGFSVNEQTGCPLRHIEKPHSDLNEFLGIVDRVVKFRSSEERGV